MAAATGQEGWAGNGVSPFPFDPDRPAREAPALWRAGIASSVVTLDRAPPGFPGGLVLDAATAPIVHGDDDTGRHLVVDSHGFRHRLWLREPESDVPLIILLSPIDDAARASAVLAARCLFAQTPPAERSSALFPSRYLRQRLSLLLAILDATLGGASNRQIGTRLIYPWLANVGAVTWKGSSERRRTQRLIAEAQYLMRDGYRTLLARA